MRHVADKVRVVAELVLKGRWASAFRRLRRWISWDTLAYGLRRDLSVPFEAPPAKIPLAVRPLRESDIERLVGEQGTALTGDEAFQLKSSLALFRLGIRTCYVATTLDDQPCFLQWLIGSTENERLLKYYKGFHAPLAPDQALMEYGFTLKPLRGRGIMSCALARIAEKGRELGVRWVITYVSQRNPAALKGCKRAGFSPYLLRRESWRFFRRRVSFTLLPAGTPYPFEAPATSQSSEPAPSSN